MLQVHVAVFVLLMTFSIIVQKYNIHIKFYILTSYLYLVH